MLNYTAVIPKRQGLKYVVNLYLMVEQDCAKQARQQEMINSVKNGVTLSLINLNWMGKEIYRYTNADFKTYLYVRIHLKIIP